MDVLEFVVIYFMFGKIARMKETVNQNRMPSGACIFKTNDRVECSTKQDINQASPIAQTLPPHGNEYEPTIKLPVEIDFEYMKSHFTMVDNISHLNRAFISHLQDLLCMEYRLFMHTITPIILFFAHVNMGKRKVPP